MIKSNLNSALNYKENPLLEEQDVNYKTVLYELELFKGYDGKIALGNVSYEHVDKNILSFPVYLINNGFVVSKIGIYEIFSDKYQSLLDDDGYLDISKLDNPLPNYYSFFNEKFLKEKIDKKEETSNKDLELEKEIREKISYKEQQGDEWIKRYMKNGNYSLIDNEGGGDCLFAVIRDGFKDIRELSVDNLRNIVSNSTKQKNFNDFKEHYDMYNNELVRLRQEQLSIKNEIAEIKKNLKELKDRNEKLVQTQKAKTLYNKFKGIEKDKENVKEMLEEFKWMKNVKNLEELKEKIKTCDFWADSWAINVLEKALNIKLIILSSSNYDYGDLDNVLQCGDFVDDDIVQKKIFDPEYYIIVSYTGDHYKLITYNQTRIFKFDNLPQTIKDMIVTKCMEKDNGIYDYIPDFKKLKDTNKDNKKELESKQGPELMQESFVSEQSVKDKIKANFDEDIVFQFYSKSKDSKPGKGSGEKISLDNEKRFYELNKINNWRRVLSNFYITKNPMIIDGKKWTSVEHYYHANKFKKNSLDFYNQFSLDSESELSKDPVMAKGAGGKTGKYKNILVRPKSVKMDEDFFSSKTNEKVMYSAQLSKYKNDELANKVLMETKNAKLVHYVRGDKPVVFYTTMMIRDFLKQTD
tara:strand:- start:3453 stop:5366 length:1914 start_codon:yes stop_codon:yes gene_type:complete